LPKTRAQQLRSKQLLSVLWAVGVLIAIAALLFLAIKVYKKYRKE
jgi:beta-lactamase regulating signal transducer with metallopeptidase domain